MHNEHSLPFKSYVPNILNCLVSADDALLATAKSALVEMFK
jgi:hypothetical protein